MTNTELLWVWAGCKFRPKCYLWGIKWSLLEKWPDRWEWPDGRVRRNLPDLTLDNVYLWFVPAMDEVALFKRNDGHLASICYDGRTAVSFNADPALAILIGIFELIKEELK